MSDLGIDQLFRLLWPDFGALFQGRLEGITALIIVVIILLGLGSLGYAERQRRMAARRIRQIHELFDGVATNELVARRRELNERAKQSDETVRHLWREFDETLVESPDRESLWNTLDAEHFFSSHTLSPRLMHNRLLTVVPSLLTAIGVLGTFIGLTTGLNGLELQSQSTVEELSKGIDQLIGGAAVAFMTSVWGVFFSLVTNFVEKAMERDIAHRISQLQRQVDELFKRHAPEQSLVQIMDSSSETSVAMQELHEKIGSKLQEAIEGISSDLQSALTHAIETAMAPSMERLAADAAGQSTMVLEQLLGTVTTSLERVGATQAERMDAASDGLTSALGSLSDGVSAMLEDIQAGADAQRAATAQQSAEFQEQLAQLTAMTTRQAEILDASLSSILRGLETASARITDTTANLARAAADLDGSAEKISTTSAGLGAVLEQSLARLEEIKQQHESAAELLTQHSARLEALQATTLTAGETLGAAAASANEGFEALRTHQKQFVTELKEQVEGLTSSMAKWLNDYGDSVIHQTNERMDVWNQQSRTYASQMVSAAEALSAVIDEIGVNGHARSAPAQRN